MTSILLSALSPAAAFFSQPSAVFAVLAVLAMWTLSSRASWRSGSPFDTRRTLALREAARLHDENRYSRERHPRSSPVVFVSHPWEERWWCEKLNVPAATLRAAIREVGPMAADVQRHLGVTVR